jgi:hypothetical protein
MFGLRRVLPLGPRGFCGELTFGLRDPFGRHAALPLGAFPLGLGGALAFGLSGAILLKGVIRFYDAVLLRGVLSRAVVLLCFLILL